MESLKFSEIFRCAQEKFLYNFIKTQEIKKKFLFINFILML